MERELEIAWAAGLFEGEGCISMLNQNGRIRVRFTMALTDLDVLERFHAITECGAITGPFWYETSTRHIWRWSATARGEVELLADLFVPFLGLRRLERLMECVEAFSTQPPPLPNWQLAKTHCPRGHEYAGHNLMVYESDGRRRCRTCERDRATRRRLTTEDTRESIELVV